MSLTNWPFTREQVKTAIGVKPGDQQPPDDDLELWAAFVTELVDRRTGRLDDPERHLIDVITPTGPGRAVPVAFVMAARASARLLWRQEKNGPRRADAGTPGVPDVPAGADMPAKAKSWLADYPPAPGIA